MKEYLQIFWAFIKVGALTFGGGYAMLPILQRDIVEHNKWATEEEVMDYYAMAQCLPGIIMVNTSVFIGSHRKGTAGGIVAGLACAAVAGHHHSHCMFLTAFAEYAVVQNAFAGIRACVVVLIANAVIKLWKSAMVDWKSIVIIFLPVFLLSAFTGVSPILLVVAAAAAGIVITALSSHKEGGEQA